MENRGFLRLLPTFAGVFRGLQKKIRARPSFNKSLTNYTSEQSLRRLERVFIFPILGLQILFQIQFGLSYQCEIYRRHK